jgi:hypothetical protein
MKRRADGVWLIAYGTDGKRRRVFRKASPPRAALKPVQVVCLVCLVSLVCEARRNELDKLDKRNKRNEPKKPVGPPRAAKGILYFPVVLTNQHS